MSEDITRHQKNVKFAKDLKPYRYIVKVENIKEREATTYIYVEDAYTKKMADTTI